MRPTGTAADLEARRRRAIKLLAEGWMIKDVAAAVGASRQSVSTWKKLAGTRGEGAKALAAVPQHLPQCRLSTSERSKLIRLLRVGPRKSGFNSDLWTLPRVTALIDQTFGVSYHSTHVGRLLHSLGFSCQKPERRSKEQDPEAVRVWRETKWPAIKKGGSRAS